MPNWCNNEVTIVHKNKTAIDRVVKAFTRDRLCKEFIPVPQELLDVQDSNTENTEQLIEKHGFPSWYEFCIAKWGTKWDPSYGIFTRINNKSVLLQFDSAWSPPLGLYEVMAKEGYDITAHYYEPGGDFAGTWTSADGGLHYSIGEMPKELDELFGHSANQEMWEE